MASLQPQGLLRAPKGSFYCIFNYSDLRPYSLAWYFRETIELETIEKIDMLKFVGIDIDTHPHAQYTVFTAI